MKIMVMTVIMKMIVNMLFFSNAYKCVFYVFISSVKWGHLENFEPNSTNTIFSTKILWGYLAHFRPDSIRTIKKKKKRTKCL